ncbi:Acetolactate synthase large subunit [Candidatus Rhodobacter oscarellae]|uniref:Acetolactate synthase large subunit n=1 Tax=Candidatus Rhodobacter oscarellae TaxID=1675527 RepID=A0A0J9E489_9RHOB|nr:acetolactate synthase large subunit [Candidatus Rhodobacter lobularis]KMW56654.1 Acetolactate synthase large subunit [Candidatus Rhodobacter lobularis]
MNGAESLVQTMLASGVDTVFANPGTSEMHFCAALDQYPEMNCVLCLFEGGTSAGADCYFRMKRDVAGTLLHLAPGFGNAYANLHNARKAGSGLVNIVGDHATHHLAYESPLKGDIQGVSQSISHWYRWSPDAGSVAGDGAAAIRAARSLNGQIATLALPANTAWEAARTPAGRGDPTGAEQPPALHRPETRAIEAAAQRLTLPGAALMIGGAALFGGLRQLAGQICAATGARLLIDTLIPRASRGAGTATAAHLPYPVEPKLEALVNTRSITLLGTQRPVTFFAYPGKPSLPEPANCEIAELCRPEMDIAFALDALAQATNATKAQPRVYPLDLPALPSGTLTLESAGAALAHLLPEGAIVCNEAITSGFRFAPPLTQARPHEMLGGTGGAIGWSLPGAVGAATACPDRKVVVLTGDGSAMYTIQSLWTMAREGLDVTVIVFANRGYQILRDELQNVGVQSYGANARAMFDVEGPSLDFVALAKGHGVPASRAETLEQYTSALQAALASDGPALIELVCD